MDWITQEQVKQVAKQGEIAALECSLEHHRQGRDADWVELRDAIESGKFDITSPFCGCCELVSHECPKCPLGDYWCEDDVWDKTNTAWFCLKDDYSNANFKAFQEAEAKVCDYIEGVLEKKKAEKEDINCADCKHGGNEIPCMNCEGRNKWQAKPKKESKPALRHGDYGLRRQTPVLVLKSITDEMYTAGIGCAVPPPNMMGAENMTKLGNIFDDLKRNSEDLEEFEMNGDAGLNQRAGAHIAGDENGICLEFHSTCPLVRFSFDHATEYAYKILQEVATAKRKLV